MKITVKTKHLTSSYHNMLAIHTQNSIL